MRCAVLWSDCVFHYPATPEIFTLSLHDALPISPAPFQRFLDPDQQKEWEELIKKQEKEMQEFRDKWEKKKPTPGLEKM